jgi:hypothetical protein
MSGAAAGTSTAVIVATIANAIKACGTLVRVEPHEFIKIIEKEEQPLIVRTSAGLFSQSIKYLTSYKGLAFHCKSKIELNLPAKAELINAKRFSIPDL